MDIPQLIKKESEYQKNQLKLIPSENYTSAAVRKAVGSVLMNKYAEGQAEKRYYHGNINTDAIEKLCKQHALETFGLTNTSWSVNVQAVTGAIANLAVYNALLEPGDPILAMYLPDGGHLSHGWKLPSGKPVSISAKMYDSHFYHVSNGTQQFNYDEVKKTAKKAKPKLAVLTHFGNKLMNTNPIYEARDIQKETGVQVIAAEDGMNIDPVSYSANLKQKTLNLYKKNT